MTFTFISFQPYSVVSGKATALPVRPMRAAGGQPESPCWLNWNFERCVCGGGGGCFLFFFSHQFQTHSVSIIEQVYVIHYVINTGV